MLVREGLTVCAKTLERNGTLTSDSFLHTVFSGEQFNIDNVKIGPYCDESTKDKCGGVECNIGFRTTHIWSLESHKASNINHRTHSDACTDPFSLPALFQACTSSLSCLPTRAWSL